MIKNIEKHDDVFNLGYIENNLFGKEIEVWLENTVDMDYAEKCAENFQSLKDETIDKICERISAYHEFMLDEWDDDFVEEINQKVPVDISGRETLKYIDNPRMYIFPPMGDGIGYTIEGDCEWEPEHGIEIVLLGDKVIDVGPSEGVSPWASEDEIDPLF